MISLMRNRNGAIYCYSADDWLELRTKWRIVGEIAGTTLNIPALPTTFLPEEILLLIDKNVVTVYNYELPDINSYKEEYQQYETNLYEEQKKVYKEIRRKQLTSMIDKIVEQKRKKGDTRTSDEILNYELEKSCNYPKENVIWPILISPLKPPANLQPTPRDLLESRTSTVKYLIFKDLWEKDYYITLGKKFGGDFLVYTGDPVLYHASYVVRCVPNHKDPIHPTEIVAFGRLCHSVNKIAVLSSVKDNQVSHITLKWPGF